LLQIEGVQEKSAADFYLGKRVAYIYKAKAAKAGSKFRVVWGKITRRHGSNGVVRAKFATNLSVRFSTILFFLVDVSSFSFQPTTIGAPVRVMLYPSNI
jgi:large subunit ribosomal protein L35Ae